MLGKIFNYISQLLHDFISFILLLFNYFLLNKIMMEYCTVYHAAILKKVVIGCSHLIFTESQLTKY